MSAPSAAAQPVTSRLRQRSPLTRPRSMVLSGVSAGLAQHLGWPVLAVRGIFAVLVLPSGAGILLYAWLWALTPTAQPPAVLPASLPHAAGESGNAAMTSRDAAPITRAVPVAVLLTTIAVVVAMVAMGSPAASTVRFAAAVTLVILAVSSVAWSLVFDRKDPARTQRYGVVCRTVAAVALIVTGAVLLLSDSATGIAVFAVVMVVLGAGVLATPRIVRLWTELIEERTGRVREVQRAEIAAHLHDSVLQTLALIQNRAGAQSEIARLARAQERELRDWLFAGDDPVDSDLALQVRDLAAIVELDYPVRIDVVITGDAPGLTSSALLAATKEAVLNAAHHAGGDVSVYVEFGPTAIDVYVRDRGPGIDLDSLPGDRLGIRESIVGRMSRAGGSAVVSSSSSGTEVHLHLPRSTP